MAISKNSKILMDEHQNILTVVEALETACEKIAGTGPVDEDFLKKAIEFIRNYADKLHHSKEEEILFVEMKKNNTGDKKSCNPVEQMLYEHDLGRKYIAGIKKGMMKRSRKIIVENARGYIYLIREHISKEDNILFPMSDETLDEKTKKEILTKFNKIDKEKINEIKKYVSFARKYK